MPDLATIWFILVGVLLVGYAVLDGFDLGVGMLHFVIGRSPEERRVLVRSIGPVWDGNEVWLLTMGGALFAAFPAVYATVFSGFYLALMLLLVALILRAVAIEFRGHVDDPRWVATWDVAFSIGSFLPAVLFGVAIGNVAQGVPLSADGAYEGGLIGLLNPFALLMGVVAVLM
ncbi:MAG TPA: cytochrome d ubiquinol oxidase subunit II, partial [Candidatus Limnocylindria bacterium]